MIKLFGGLIIQDNIGVEFYVNIFVIVELIFELGVIWMGSDDGFVYVSCDNGKIWMEVIFKGLFRLNMMNCIDVYFFQKGGVYLVVIYYKFGDYQLYFYKIMDYGKIWMKIVNGIVLNYYICVLWVDFVCLGLFYVGIEWGMYIFFDDGGYWQFFQLNLFIIVIWDLYIKEESLIVVIYGCSFWMIDDLGLVCQLSQEIVDKLQYFYQFKFVYCMVQVNFRGDGVFWLNGENYFNGVFFNFFVKEYKD